MKKELAIQLYSKNHNLPRKDLIDLFMRELNTTENSARTHINNAAKVLNPQLGKEYRSRKTIKPTLKKEQAKQIVISNFAKMTRKELAEKLQKDLGLKSLNSAQTHISRIIREAGLVASANP